MGANHCHCPYDVFSSLVYCDVSRNKEFFLHNSSVIKFSAAESSQQVIPVLDVHLYGSRKQTFVEEGGSQDSIAPICISCLHASASAFVVDLDQVLSSFDRARVSLPIRGLS